MKKTLLTMATALALVGCTQDNLMPGFENQPSGAIGVNAYVPTITRGTALNEVGHLVQTKNGFDLFAFVNDGTQFMGTESDGIAFQGSGTDSYTWSYVEEAEMRFWDETDQNITFYAVSPMNEITTAAPFTNSGSLTKSITTAAQTLEYSVPTTCSEQVDLMYAATSAYSPTDGVHLENGIDLQFHHALSQVVFRGKTESELIEVDVTEVQIKNLYGSGTFDIQKGLAYQANDQLEFPWSYGAATATSSYSADLGSTLPTNITTTYDSKGGYSTTNNGGNYQDGRLTDREQALLLIPQNTAENNAMISVTCSVRFNGENGEVTIVDNKTFDVGIYNEWKPGYKYVYTLIFTTDMGNPIKVNAVGVDEWDNIVEEDKYIPEEVSVAADGKFYIYNAKQLAEIRDNINNGETYSYGGALLKYSEAEYVQMANIDLTEFTPWTPISFDINFHGTYDGGNYNIENLTITGASTTASSPSYGLFGNVTGKVKNVNIVGIKTSGNYVGGVVGTLGSAATLENCTVSGTFGNSESLSYYVGGIVLHNGNGNILNCTNNAIAVNIYQYGGITFTNGGIVIGCVNHGDISGSSTLGGIVYRNSGSVVGCYNTGDISAYSGASNVTVGGIVSTDGTNSNSKITSCYNTGTLSGTTVGAIIGDVNYTLNMTSCYFSGDIEGIGNTDGTVNGTASKISDNNWSDAKTQMNNAIYNLYDKYGDQSYYETKYNIKYVDGSGDEPLVLAEGAEKI